MQLLMTCATLEQSIETYRVLRVILKHIMYRWLCLEVSGEKNQSYLDEIRSKQRDEAAASDEENKYYESVF